MPRLFCHGAVMVMVMVMVMVRSALALSLFLLISASAAQADDATPAACTVASTNILSQDQGGDVTITCTRLSEAAGQQFADILTRILQDRLDAQMVMAKLDEVDQIPAAGIARTVTEEQRQLILQSLGGKPVGLIAITAHPEAGDGPEFAKGVATALLQAGWQIEGQQIRRVALPALDLVPGLAIVVHDKATPSPQAVRLKAALNAAHITVKLIADPTLASDAALLWVGRRPVATSAEQAK